MSRDFVEQVNDIAAPITRAYSDPEIVELTIAPEDIQDSEATFTMRVKFRRNPVSLAAIV